MYEVNGRRASSTVCFQGEKLDNKQVIRIILTGLPVKEHVSRIRINVRKTVEVNKMKKRIKNYSSPTI